MKGKVLTIVVSVIVTLGCVVGYMWYMSPTQKLQRVVINMELQIKAYQYRQAIAKINSQSPKRPVVPVDPNN